MNSSQARRFTAINLRAKRVRDDVSGGGEMQTIPAPAAASGLPCAFPARSPCRPLVGG